MILMSSTRRCQRALGRTCHVTWYSWKTSFPPLSALDHALHRADEQIFAWMLDEMGKRISRRAREEERRRSLQAERDHAIGAVHAMRGAGIVPEAEFQTWLVRRHVLKTDNVLWGLRFLQRAAAREGGWGGNAGQGQPPPTTNDMLGVGEELRFTISRFPTMEKKCHEKRNHLLDMVIDEILVIAHPSNLIVRSHGGSDRYRRAALPIRIWADASEAATWTDVCRRDLNIMEFFSGLSTASDPPPP